DLRPGQRPILEHSLGDLEIKRLELRVAKVLSLPGTPGKRVSGAEQPRRDQERRVAEVPPGADEPSLGQLVLPPPELVELRREPSRLPSLVPDRPVGVETGNSLPEGRQDQIRLPPGERNPHAIHECRSVLERPNPHDASLLREAGFAGLSNPCGPQRGGPRGKPGFPRDTERAAFAAR